MTDWFPHSAIIYLWLAFHFGRFEHQRWWRSGKRGANQIAAAAVEFTQLFATLFGWGFLIAFAIFISWREALVLLVLGFVAGLLWAAIIPEKWWIWMLGTLTVWLSTVALVILVVL